MTRNTKDEPEYTIIPPEQVQPGDVYKFVPADGNWPRFARVVAVQGKLVQFAPLDGGLPTGWTPIHPPAGRVVFGRRRAAKHSTMPSESAAERCSAAAKRDVAVSHTKAQQSKFVTDFT